MDGVNMFDEFWKIYPHHGARSKKAIAQAKWRAITNGGLDTRAKDEGGMVPLFLQANCVELIKGVKAYCMSLSDSDLQYVPGAQIWLNQGRWMDFDNASELAERYDRMKGLEARLAGQGKLRVVNG